MPYWIRGWLQQAPTIQPVSEESSEVVLLHSYPIRVPLESLPRHTAVLKYVTYTAPSRICSGFGGLKGGVHHFAFAQLHAICRSFCYFSSEQWHRIVNTHT